MRWKFTKEEIAEAAPLLSVELKQAIEMSRRNIWKFHSEQQHDYDEIQTSPGVYCWQKAIPIEKVGFYIPGGSAPLFSTVLMLGIPAQIATAYCRHRCPHKARIFLKLALSSRISGIG